MPEIPTLYHLIGLAIADPATVVDRQKRETTTSWQCRAVRQVLEHNGVDVDAPASSPMAGWEALS